MKHYLTDYMLELSSYSVIVSVVYNFNCRLYCLVNTYNPMYIFTLTVIVSKHFLVQLSKLCNLFAFHYEVAM